MSASVPSVSDAFLPTASVAGTSSVVASAAGSRKGSAASCAMVIEHIRRHKPASHEERDRPCSDCPRGREEVALARVVAPAEAPPAPSSMPIGRSASCSLTPEGGWQGVASSKLGI